MVDYFRGNKTVDEQVYELLNTYRTPFWLNKYGWFVRCDWNPGIGNFYLYTLPYAFDYFDISDSTIWKSTCLDEKNQYSYDAVHHLNYDVKPEQFPQLSVKAMHKLRLLFVQCDDDKGGKRYRIEDGEEEENSTEDELLSWLRQQLAGIRPFIEISRSRYTIVLRLL
ncbi:unnamed protein product [Rotaria sp. Silwood1]|nr:unnamed protein product [Rotaria sp. Silwood1]CAF3653064.1 unnamed protein product [Rotaria sp. Silwood1]CAF3667227.1 unnamed protein product [Rotaria sp. Silwood1]CAF3671595.1 unnamed protein product [Rotaria sp. Silwood1]CAF4672404.1 unnamed protein product [Rotaria sp. Silwood1]